MKTGSAVSPAGVLPAERAKQAGRGRGVGREKEAHSPPGSDGGWENRRGVLCPRKGYCPPKERSKLAADGEWDARRKLIPRPVSPVVGKTDGECCVHGRGTARRKSEASWSRTGSGTREGSLHPARFRRWLGKPTGSAVSTAGVLPAERSKQAWSRAGSGTRKRSLFPARSRPWQEKLAGSAMSTAGVLPAGRSKRGYSPPKERSKYGCGRGVGREKEAHSPPGSVQAVVRIRITKTSHRAGHCGYDNRLFRYICRFLFN